MVWGSNPGGWFSTPIQTGPGAQPAFHTMGTRSLPGVKRLWRGIDHPPPCSTKVKERVQLYLYYPSGLLWPVIGRTLPYLLHLHSTNCFNDVHTVTISSLYRVHYYVHNTNPLDLTWAKLNQSKTPHQFLQYPSSSHLCLCFQSIVRNC